TSWSRCIRRAPRRSIRRSRHRWPPFPKAPAGGLGKRWGGTPRGPSSGRARTTARTPPRPTSRARVPATGRRHGRIIRARPRPIACIREAVADGNPLTSSDPDWEPLNAFTPPFPTYISGHATFASAAAATFARFFETDGITHTIGTEDPLYTGGPRTYTNFLD